MVVRYYNLKEDREDVSGVVIAVDVLPSGNKVSEFSNESYRFKLVGRRKNEGIESYQVYGNPYFVGSQRAAVPSLAIDSLPGVSIGNSDERPFRLDVHSDGSLEVRVIKDNFKVFLSEISEKEAKKIREDAANWVMLQAWVAG